MKSSKLASKEKGCKNSSKLASKEKGCKEFEVSLEGERTSTDRSVLNVL
jgi:hypothetical protein